MEQAGARRDAAEAVIVRWALASRAAVLLLAAAVRCVAREYDVSSSGTVAPPYDAVLGG